MKLFQLCFYIFVSINSYSQKLQQKVSHTSILRIIPNCEEHCDTIAKSALENPVKIIISPYQANCIVQSFEVVYATANDSLLRKTFQGNKVVIDIKDEFFKRLKEPGNNLLQFGKIYALYEKRRVKLPSIIVCVQQN